MTAMLLINAIGMALIATAIVSLLTWAIVSHRRHELQDAQVVTVEPSAASATRAAPRRHDRRPTARPAWLRS